MPYNTIWKPVPGYGGRVIVSDHGEVYDRKWRRPRALTELQGGYKRVALAKCPLGMKGGGITLHRLVAIVFHGPCPEGMVCRHLNGNPADNRADNLRWGTHLENSMDAWRHGTLKAAANRPEVQRKRLETAVKNGVDWKAITDHARSVMVKKNKGLL